MPADSIYQAEDAHEPRGARTPKKAAIASWIGSALEYYDFFIYGTAAALVFGKIFFRATIQLPGSCWLWRLSASGMSPGRLALSCSANVGDKFGRKKVLIFTLIFMGASTFLVGCLPPYGKVGVLAPILLVILRLAQGFSASGEQAGANSLTLEHAPPRRRAYYTSFTLSGTQAGAHPCHRRVPSYLTTARGSAIVMGMADPVLAQRSRCRGRIHYPAHLGRNPGLQRGAAG